MPAPEQSVPVVSLGNKRQEVVDLNDYHNILAAADFSDAGDAAARRAGVLTRRLRAKLTLLHVLEHFPEDRPVDMIPPEDVDPQTYLMDRIRDRLKELSERIGQPDAILDIVVSTRSANREIVNYAQNNSIDLIVVGGHAQRGLLGTLGSTANGAMHAATVDVLVVRPGG